MYPYACARNLDKCHNIHMGDLGTRFRRTSCSPAKNKNNQPKGKVVELKIESEQLQHSLDNKEHKLARYHQ